MKITRQPIARGYEPVAKLDTNLMASRKALTKMGFLNSEIDKIYMVTKARQQFAKRSKELAKLSKKGKTVEDIMVSPENPMCDICGNKTGLGMAKLTTTEQGAKLPSGWALVHFGSPNQNNYSPYFIVPLGIVIDYKGGRVYVVCGNCQLILGLKATESGILINEIRKGYGFVDLDRIETLMQEHRRQ